MKKSKLSLLLASAIVACGTIQAQKVAVTKNQKLENSTVVKVSMNMQMGEQSIDNITHISTNTEILVKEVTYKEFVLAYTVKRITNFDWNH
jgi:uncharacterized OsmC-like protein